jgi:hypothetical protein
MQSCSNAPFGLDGSILRDAISLCDAATSFLLEMKGSILKRFFSSHELTVTVSFMTILDHQTTQDEPMTNRSFSTATRSGI